MQNPNKLSLKGYFYFLLHEWIIDALRISQTQAEQKLSQPHQYIDWLESLSFHVLHHPLGATPEQVAGMLAADLITQENIYPVGTDGSIIWEYERSGEIPHVFQYRIQDDAQLARIVTDLVELARIRAEAETAWESYQYPIVSLMNPPALRQWAAYMGKRLPKDNAEQNEILKTLPWDNVENKMKNGGIPRLGILDMVWEPQVESIGGVSYLITTAPYEKMSENYDALLLDFKNRDAQTVFIRYSGVSRLLLEDK